MRQTVFFSWQMDTPTIIGRNFVEKALTRAAKAVSEDAEVEEVVREGLDIDSDTRGIAGSPPIVDTIFKKIDRAAIFVADLTFAGTRPDGKPIPNPNVLIEYGWALKSIGYNRIISVMNTAFGDPKKEEMPFDLAHLRHPIQFNCPKDPDETTRIRERDRLTKALESAIKDIVNSEEYKKALPKPAERPMFQRRQPAEGRGRFRKSGEALGVNDRLVGWEGSTAELFLRSGPAAWLRVMPQFDPQRQWTIAQLKEIVGTSSSLMPIVQLGGGYQKVRGGDGIGMCGTDANGGVIDVAFVFKTGEVWAVDVSLLLISGEGERMLFFSRRDELFFCRALERYISIFDNLGIPGPYRWIAGLEDTQGRIFPPPVQPGKMPNPWRKQQCLTEYVEAEGVCASLQTSRDSIRPFFEAIYDSCGMERPAWLDDQS